MGGGLWRIMGWVRMGRRGFRLLLGCLRMVLIGLRK